jgi:hypothetical protein
VQAGKTKISGKYPVIVGLFPANISENGAIKAFKKTQKQVLGMVLSRHFLFKGNPHAGLRNV